MFPDRSNCMKRDCFGYDYVPPPIQSRAQPAGSNSPSDFIEEWKTATSTSQEFDKMLVDLRKYGFSIITGLITAGSFLGLSFDKSTLLPAASSVIHIGVINVTMFLVVILFWLDIYYQNLLYGSVFRTRFLEFFRLKYRLSIYISGMYTGSSMGTILYLIYGGFLVGVFILGLLVAGIANQSEMISKSESNYTTAAVSSNITQGSTNMSVGNANPVNNGSLLNLITKGYGSLILSFILGAAGMIAIAVIGISSRSTKLNELTKIFEKYLLKKEQAPTLELSEREIMELEKEICRHFKHPSKV